MFYSTCSAEVLSSDAKFCYSCGGELDFQASAEPKPKPASRSALTFDEFRKRKADERCSRFKPKDSNKKAAKPSKAQDPEVTIQIGVMIWKDDCCLTPKRGCNLPLKIPSNATADVLMDRAVSRQNRFNSGLVKSCDGIGYKLLFPDKKVVESNFIWDNSEFSLRRYKEELGKPYSRIVFYVCSNIDYLSHLQSDGIDGSISDSDESDGSNGQSSKNSSKIVTSTSTECKEVNVQVFH